MKRKIAAILACTVLMSLQLPVFAQNSGETYFVSPLGNDENIGSYSEPFKSFEKAQEEIRKKIEAGVPEGGITVYFREGTYEFREKGIELTEEDSGTKQSPITYSAYNGEKVRFVGGVELRQENFRRTTDESVLNRIYDENARKYIYEYDLSEYNGLIAKNIPIGVYWDAEVFTPNMLIRDDDIETTAQWPNNDDPKYKSFARIEQVVTRDDKAKTSVIEMNEIYIDRMSYWKKKDWATMYVHNFIQADWRDSSANVARVQGNLITLTGAYTPDHGKGESKEVRFINLLPELDRPGEYFVDVDNLKLYYFPPSDSGKNSKFFLTTLNQNFITVNADNIKFKGITFSGGHDNGILIENAENVIFDFCEVLNMGDHAAKIGYDEQRVDAKNCGIKNSNIRNVGNGVTINAGDVKSIDKGNCFLYNCDISNWGIFTMCYNLGIGLNGCANSANNNKLHNGPHMAVWSGGILNEFAYNDISDVLQYVADSGALYMNSGMERLGNDLHNNWFHDCELNPSKKGSAYGIRAFYFDEYELGKITRNNLITNFDGYGILINGGSFCETTNNVVYNTKHAPITVQPGPGGEFHMLSKNGTSDRISGFAQSLNNTITEKWYEYWPYLQNLWETNMGVMRGNVTKRNVAVDTPEYTFAYQNSKENHDVDSNVYLKAEEVFVDAENGDFNIKPDSKVYTEVPGFEDIEFYKMGSITDKSLTPVRDAIVLAADKAGAMNKGKLSLIDSENHMVKSMVEDGRTFVPLRFIAEALGLNVGWDAATQTATLEGNGKVVKFQIGADTYEINNEIKTLDAPARVFENRTLIPIRACAEAFEKKVSWNEKGLVVIGEDENVFDDTDNINEIEYLIDKLDI